jgi:3-oxoacyl-[acyl-carrier protein] reductase
VTREVEAAGAYVVSFSGDLVAPQGVEQLIDAAVNRFKGLDALVCCVGSTPLGTFETIDDAAWQQAWEGKVLATVRAVRAALPHLQRSTQARLVIIAGNSTYDPDPAMLTSAVSNAALGALTACVARQYAAEKIGAVCLDPGPTDTARFDRLTHAVAAAQGIEADQAARQLRARVPTGRITTPEEIATMVAFCLSPRLPQLTGTRVVVDGAATWVR